MTQRFYYILLMFLLSSCKKKELMTYQGVDNVSFDYDGKRDSSFVTFKSTLANKLDAELLVKITGKVSTQDRLFHLSVDEKKSTAKAGLHYEALVDTFNIAAGKTTAKINIRFLKDIDLDDQQYILALKLMPNSNFQTELKFFGTSNIALDEYRFFLSNRLIISQNWSSFESLLGSYSPKKVQILNEIGKMDLIRFYQQGGYTYAEYFEMSRTVQLHLNRQKSLGNVILNDDGTEMVMGDYVQ